MKNTTPLVLAACMLCHGFSGSAGAQQQRNNARFDQWDRNGDGYVSKEEFPARLGAAVFARVDLDKDGRISREEDLRFRARRTRARQAPPDTDAQFDVVYSRVGDRGLRLDFYRPKASDKTLPLVIWVHGGGWRGGSKDNVSRAIGLVARGYALATVEYRLSGEAKFPAAIEDCKAAVSFLRHNAVKFKIDPQRFGAWGSSAGGHLVALLGVTNNSRVFDTHPICAQASSRVQAVCDWFGPTDFLRMNDVPGSIDHDSATSPESLFIGGLIQENKEKVARANPITYVDKTDPPILIMHGDKDRAVIYNQSELFYAALQKAGVQSRLYRVRNGDHGFRGADDAPQKLFEMVADFFDRELGRSTK